MPQETNVTSYAIERLDHLGVIAGVIKDLKIAELIDERLDVYEGETLSAGETVAGMIINYLGLSSTPLTAPTCMSYRIYFRSDVLGYLQNDQDTYNSLFFQKL